MPTNPPKGICRKIWVYEGTVVMCNLHPAHEEEHQYGLLVRPVAEGWGVIGILTDPEDEEDTTDPATWNWEDPES